MTYAIGAIAFLLFVIACLVSATEAVLQDILEVERERLRQQVIMNEHYGEYIDQMERDA